MIRVIIVDDSALVRKMFTEILNSDPDIEVVGVAADPYIARELIKQLNPDVITLDIEMPKMDGLSFLEKIMSLRPMPVVMISSMTQKGAQETIAALELGAVDCIGKPRGDQENSLQTLSDEIISKIKIAAKAKIRGKVKTLSDKNIKTVKLKKTFDPSQHIVAIGASTGGVEAIRDILPKFPSQFSPVLITQHMPEAFTKSFAERLNTITEMTVKEASDRVSIEPGHVYVAPGNKHLMLGLNRSGHGFVCILKDGEKVSGHRPSVDVLFESVAENAGKRAVGIMLTGMGKDGAEGMLKMKKAGAFNIAQDEASCVVYGMPKAAYLSGAVDLQIPLDKIAKEIVKQCDLTMTEG